MADGNGRTLYVYVDDLLTKASSACTGDCANDWPPALVSGRVALARGVTGHEKSTGIPLSFAEKVTEPGASYAVVHAGYILVYTQGAAHMEFPAEIRPSQETQDLVSLVQHGWHPH